MTFRLNHIVKNLSALMAVALFSALASCIGDSLDDCPADLSLRFEYMLNDGREDLFAVQVTHLDLCLYDKDGYYLTTYHLPQSGLENGNTAQLSLPAGSYTFVAWANMPENVYECTYAPTLNEVRVKLNTALPGEADPAHGSLFHGMATATLAATVNSRQTISLTKNTHRVHVLLEETGNSAPLQMGDYSVQISGTNGSYKFDNVTAGGDLLNYTSRYTSVDTHTMQSDHTLLRLLAGDDLTIQIRDAQGKVVYNEPLTAKIMESPAYNNNEDLDCCDEFTLRYQIEKTGDAWSVSFIGINDWEVTSQGGGVGG